nr:PREDICTED: leucine-rich PPR motif-containing protein, mitochondrial-like isoform X2 [Megachile rotundata]
MLNNDDVTPNQVYSLLKWSNNINDSSPHEKMKLVESLWINLAICNFKLNVVHYNTLLQVYIDNNYNFSPPDILMEMKDNEILPNFATYHMCIKHYCIKGNVNEAMSLLTSGFVKIPWHYLIQIFNTLLVGYSQLGNIKSVDNILYIMENRNIKPTADTYAVVMCTYAKLNDINKIKEIIQDCHSRKMYFTNTHILRVIYTLAANNHLESVDAMYEYLKNTLNISNAEMQVIMDIFNIGQVNIVTTLFSHMLSQSYVKYTNTKLLLRYAIDVNLDPNKIIEICNSFNHNIELYKKLLSFALYYSLSKNSHVSLALLRACKPHYTIKAHYFWPLLSNYGLNCDFDGILNILTIMITEFNIPPCVHTISDYILSILFVRSPEHTRQLLIKYKVDKTVVNNAYLLMYLRTFRTIQAAIYMRSHPDKYFYKIHSHELRKASVLKNDIESFIMISTELLENTTDDYNHRKVFVSMDKQLQDAMIDLSSNKQWLAKVLQRLVAKNIVLKPETVREINTFLHGYLTDDIVCSLENLAKKTPSTQVKHAL